MEISFKGPVMPIDPYSQLAFVEILNIISDIQSQLIRHDPLFNEVKGKDARHFHSDQPSFIVFVWVLQHLTGTDRTVLRTIGFDVGNGARLPAPSVIYEQFRIDAEHPVKQIFILDRHPGDIAHSVHPGGFQFVCISFADSPKVGQRSM